MGRLDCWRGASLTLPTTSHRCHSERSEESQSLSDGCGWNDRDPWTSWAVAIFGWRWAGLSAIDRVVRNCTPRRAGFSLIEVLTVTLVIGLLAALLLPVLARARERSRAAVCLNNLRQLGQAAIMYDDDYGRLPLASTPGNKMWDGARYLLFAQMLPASGAGAATLARTFFCPSSRLYRMDDPGTGLGNLGVPGRTTANSYWTRGTDQGAPATFNGVTKALVADLYHPVDGARNHPSGINVLYSDGSTRYHPLPASWDITASNAWPQLDGPTILAMP